MGIVKALRIGLCLLLIGAQFSTWLINFSCNNTIEAPDPNATLQQSFQATRPTFDEEQKRSNTEIAGLKEEIQYKNKEVTKMKKQVSQLNATLQKSLRMQSTFDKKQNRSIKKIAVLKEQLQTQVTETKRVVSNLNATLRQGLLTRRPTFNEEQQLSNMGYSRKKSPERSLFGFFYQAHTRPKATLEVIKSFQKHMPAAPIYLLSSGGYHYDPLVKRFPNLNFVYDDFNINLHGEGGQLDRWFNWLKTAALWCNCEYLVLLEDDTILLEPLVDKPEHDAGGTQTSYEYFHWPEVIETQFGTNFSYFGYGMCGGSYVSYHRPMFWEYVAYGSVANFLGMQVRVEAFLDAYSQLNWTRVFAMREASDWRIGMISDITLALIMMDAGYVLKPWKDHGTLERLESNTTKILHKQKYFYKKRLSPNDGRVISDNLDRNESDKVFSKKKRLSLNDGRVISDKLDRNKSDKVFSKKKRLSPKWPVISDLKGVG